MNFVRTLKRRDTPISSRVGVALAGLGTATPEHIVEQADTVAFARGLVGDDCDRQRFVAGIYGRSGVRRRHSVLLNSTTPGQSPEQSFYSLPRDAADSGPTTAQRMAAYEQHATELARRAAAQALGNAATDPAAITHLITVSCSGFHAPGVDVTLVREFGMSPTAQRTHIGFMGCHGVLNGLRVAKAFIEADPRARVLLCAVELCSLHHQYGWNPERIVANALFADGAAAAVLCAIGPSDSPGSHLRLVSTASRIVPETESLMSWRIGDHGFEMSLSPQVPEVLGDCLRPWLGEWLGEHGISLDEITSWAIHPGGPKIHTACANALNLSPALLAPSREVLSEFGNMSSPTVLFILQRLLARSSPLPHVLLAFGPGLTLEGALLHPGEELTNY